jgi:glutamate---cysteine ligase / carboxylate-amine ligase
MELQHGGGAGRIGTWEKVMGLRTPSLRLGIEEEYLLVDPASGELVTEQDPAFMPACRERLGEQVTHELLQGQVEVGSRICPDVGAARTELFRLRRTVAEIAGEHGMAIVAASTHPSAVWSDQRSTEKLRYQTLTDDLQMLARRQVISGMHIHAEIEDADLRIDLMNQVTYFLPHLLALSTSSPFWNGHDTGLKAYRRAVADELPRSGSPEHLESWRDWERLVEVLAATGLVQDASMIWWDIRPSIKHPTLELRITDICTDVEDALTIAALYQSLLRHLWRLRTGNQSWRIYRRILIEENKWRAQRWGVDAELADFAAGRLRPMGDLVEELIGLVREDAAELGCLPELERAREIVAAGTSADRQLAVYRRAIEGGGSPEEGHRAVIHWLVDRTLVGPPR